MIVEIVRFTHPAGHSREEIRADAHQVLDRWRAERELMRKHFLVDADNRQGAGIYFWTDRAAAQHAHNAEWIAQKEQATGAKVTIEYFDLLLLLDNETGIATDYS